MAVQRRLNGREGERGRESVCVEFDFFKAPVGWSVLAVQRRLKLKLGGQYWPFKIG